MSLARILWVSFCCLLCICWLTVGWMLPVINLGAALLSLLAIFIPIGKSRSDRIQS